MNESDATTVAPDHVGGEWSLGSGCRRTNHALRSKEHAHSGTYRHDAAPAVPTNAVVDDSYTTKCASLPINSSLLSKRCALGSPAAAKITSTSVFHRLTAHQHHESSKSLCEPTREGSPLPNRRAGGARNAVSLSTLLLSKGNTITSAVPTRLDTNKKRAATGELRAGGSAQRAAARLPSPGIHTKPTPHLKSSDDRAVNYRQLSTLHRDASLATPVGKTVALEHRDKRQGVGVGSKSAANNVQARLSTTAHALLLANAAQVDALNKHTPRARKPGRFLISDEQVQNQGDETLLPPTSRPGISGIDDVPAENVTTADEKAGHPKVITQQPVCEALKVEERSGSQAGLTAEKSAGDKSYDGPQSSVRGQQRKPRKRKSNKDEAIGGVTKPKAKAVRRQPERKKAKKTMRRAPDATQKAAADSHDKLAQGKATKDRKRKNKSTVGGEKRRKRGRPRKVRPPVDGDEAGTVRGMWNGGKQVGTSTDLVQTPVARSMFLENDVQKLPRPRESARLYRARRAGGDDSSMGEVRLPALNFGEVAVSKERLPPIPKKLLLKDVTCEREVEGNDTDTVVELDEGMAHDRDHEIGADRSKAVSKIHQTEQNATMSGAKCAGDGAQVRKNGCTLAVDSDNEEIRRLRKEVQMLRALLLWKESGGSGGDTTVSTKNEETVQVIRAGCEEGSGRMERTLRAVRMVRLGELLSRLDSDVCEASERMDEMATHVLHMRHEGIYEHCVYEGMQFIGYEMSLGSACDKSVSGVLRVFDVVKRGVLAAWRARWRAHAATGDGDAHGDAHGSAVDAMIAHVGEQLAQWMRSVVRDGVPCLSWSHSVCCAMGADLRVALQAAGCARGSEALRTELRRVLRETEQRLLQLPQLRARGATAALCRAAEARWCIIRALRARGHVGTS